jgi:hypothetical protein
VKRVSSAVGAINQLIHHDEVAHIQLWLQRSDRTRPQDRANPEGSKSPDVGSEGHPVRRELVPASMASEKGDSASGHRPDTYWRSGGPEWRADLDVGSPVDEIVETRPAEHADLDIECFSTMVEGNLHYSWSV